MTLAQFSSTYDNLQIMQACSAVKDSNNSLNLGEVEISAVRVSSHFWSNRTGDFTVVSSPPKHEISLSCEIQVSDSRFYPVKVGIPSHQDLGFISRWIVLQTI